MNSFFSGKVVIVTGASSGIGKALAGDMWEAGAKVVLVARNKDKLSELAELLGKEQVLVCPADVTKPDEITSVIEQVIKKYGRIDILVNCAGIFKAGSLGEQTLEVINKAMEVNYSGTVNCVKAVLPQMAGQGNGNIVILSSLAGRVAFPGCAAYSASKFALYGFSNTIRPELRKSGIRLTAVYPSFVDSPLVEGHIDSVKESFFFRLTRDFSTKKVSRAIMKGIVKRKREMVLPGSLTLTASLYGICPNLVEGVVGRLHGGWPDLFNKS